MSNSSQEHPAQLRIDPIVVVGALLLTLFLLVGGAGLLRSLFADDGVADASGVTSAENNLMLPTARFTETPLALAAFPSATNTPSPTPTDLPTVVPAASAMATPLPLPTVLPSPTSPPRTPIARTAAPLTDEGLDPFITPTPTPTATPPLPTPSAPDGTAARVPILMYHYVSSPPAGADIYRTDLSVLPSELLKQLQYLQANGYTTVTLYDLARSLAGQQALPPKPIILTFDDGHLDNYINAFPVLKSMGMVGTFFIITDLPDIGHPDYMSWPMIEEMAAAGMQIEIHTKSHRSLAERDETFLTEEIAGSQEIIAFHTGTLPRFLAYPGGSYDDATVAAAANLDLWGALTTQHGYTHDFSDRYELRRVRIRHTTSINFFAEWIEGEELNE